MWCRCLQVLPSHLHNRNISTSLLEIAPIKLLWTLFFNITISLWIHSISTLVQNGCRYTTSLVYSVVYLYLKFCYTPGATLTTMALQLEYLYYLTQPDFKSALKSPNWSDGRRRSTWVKESLTSRGYRPPRSASCVKPSYRVAIWHPYDNSTCYYFDIRMAALKEPRGDLHWALF